MYINELHISAEIPSSWSHVGHWTVMIHLLSMSIPDICSKKWCHLQSKRTHWTKTKQAALFGSCCIEIPCLWSCKQVKQWAMESSIILRFVYPCTTYDEFLCGSYELKEEGKKSWCCVPTIDKRREREYQAAAAAARLKSISWDPCAYSKSPKCACVVNRKVIVI